MNLLPERFLLEISLEATAGFEQILWKTFHYNNVQIHSWEQKKMLGRMHAVLLLEGERKSVETAKENLTDFFALHERNANIHLDDRQIIPGLYEREVSDLWHLRVLYSKEFPQEVFRAIEILSAAAPQVTDISLTKNSFPGSGLEKLWRASFTLDSVDSVLDYLRTTSLEYSLLPASFYPSVVVMDMDSTLIENETIDEIAAEAGFGEKVAEITERAMKGELDFNDALRERVALLEGLPVSVLEKVRDRLQLVKGAPELLSEFQRRGIEVYLASGGFTFFTGFFAEELPFHDHFSNVLEEKDGILTGRVVGEIVNGATKQSILEKKASEKQISLADSIAIGDGANDSGMVSQAGAGVAFDAKPALRKIANVAVNERNLSRILPLLFG